LWCIKKQALMAMLFLLVKSRTTLAFKLEN
jgi:hypothetical protein